MIRGYWTEIEKGVWGGKIPGDYELGEEVEAELEAESGRITKVTLEIIKVEEGEFEFEGQNIGKGKVLKKKRKRLKESRTPETYVNNHDENGMDWMKMTFSELVAEINKQQEVVKKAHKELSQELTYLANLNKVLNFRMEKAEEARKKQEEKQG